MPKLYLSGERDRGRKERIGARTSPPLCPSSLPWWWVWCGESWQTSPFSSLVLRVPPPTKESRSECQVMIRLLHVGAVPCVQYCDMAEAHCVNPSCRTLVPHWICFLSNAGVESWPDVVLSNTPPTLPPMTLHPHHAHDSTPASTPTPSVSLHIPSTSSLTVNTPSNDSHPISTAFHSQALYSHTPLTSSHKLPTPSHTSSSSFLTFNSTQDAPVTSAHIPTFRVTQFDGKEVDSVQAFRRHHIGGKEMVDSVVAISRLSSDYLYLFDWSRPCPHPRHLCDGKAAGREKGDGEEERRQGGESRTWIVVGKKLRNMADQFQLDNTKGVLKARRVCKVRSRGGVNSKVSCWLAATLLTLTCCALTRILH
ncbi:hypothetical protein Pcinc_030744 [Petrolisthes cinctipes]|uniref:Uncharacterized protein n=1 Tax=Petrolisthes cinctipes TaxID=88211 RepID=A0AAE1EXQ8_PETCI|nr:hypothetical protein Pcinc_030744 [Petrolisthes cinctipes]